MIGCDLIRDLKLFNIPQDYFDELDGKYGIVKIDPDNLPSDKVLNKIQIYFGDRISLDIIENMPTLKPIDKDIIIECAKSTDMLFTVEDHSIIGGLGTAVSEVLTDSYPKKVSRIGLNDIFPESAPPTDLYEKYGLSANKIAERVINESMDK